MFVEAGEGWNAPKNRTSSENKAEGPIGVCPMKRLKLDFSKGGREKTLSEALIIFVQRHAAGTEGCAPHKTKHRDPSHGCYAVRNAKIVTLPLPHLS